MPGDITDAYVADRHDPALAVGPDKKHELDPAAHNVEVPPFYDGKATAQENYFDDELLPTPEELATLRRIPDKIPLKVYTIAMVELLERFSYYGTSAVFVNFIQKPNPGTRGGAALDPHDPQAKPGALGKGQRASTGLTTFNQFWNYVTPLAGAYLADTYFGRYKTICGGIGMAILGHVILIASAAPATIAKPDTALGVFVLGIIVMGFGTGAFKPNISPLVAEQIPKTKMRVITLKNGERVIVDPAVTIARVYNWFYFFINTGALIGQITMVYAERYIGFWLAFLLPTAMYCLAPLIMVGCRKMYHRTPPAGNVLGPAVKLLWTGTKGRWHLNPLATYRHMHDGTFWENLKPSKVQGAKPAWMETFDDAWVDEVARGWAACSVFLWFPLYWLTYNQLNNNLISQAASMELHGLPNDIFQNLDPLALIILIPVCDFLLYPALRKAGIRFTPIKKIAVGFFLGSMAMVWAAVVQAYIYKKSPCGSQATECEEPAPINVWAQTGAYILIAVSEIFASITSLEYGFSKAPKNMRSLVAAFALFMTALSAALGEAFVSLSEDPLLVWNYGSMAVLSFVGGVCFWFQYRKLDQDEDRLNMLPTGHVGTEVQRVDMERRLSVASQRRTSEKGTEASNQ
jgi:POT family proton-dependent oligopeptide transporter